MKVQEIVDNVIRALKQKDASVTYSGSRPEVILREVAKQEPILATFFDDLTYDIRRGKGLLSANTYILHFTYDERMPSYGEIISDDGKWVLSRAWKDGNHQTVYVISTNDPDGLNNRLNTDVDAFAEVCPTFREFESEQISRDFSEYVMVFVRCKFAIAPGEQESMEQMAKHAMDQVFKQQFAAGKGFVQRLPEHVRAYLPFSYLQQNTAFVDQPEDTHDTSYDASADTVYSVLCKHRGSAFGLATTYCEMAKRFHLTCKLVKGHAGTGDDWPEHTWCMVKIGDAFHHADPSFGINGEYICVDGFLKSDKEMKETHSWEASRYPECHFRSPSYHEVKAYIDNHYDDLLNAGVEENCFSPDQVDW